MAAEYSLPRESVLEGRNDAPLEALALLEDEKVPPEESEDSVENVKLIMNDVVQIKEREQHLAAVSREIVNDITGILKICNKELVLRDSGREVTLYPNGFLLTKERDDDLKSQHLTDLDPPQLHNILQLLIPRLKEDLREKKKSQEKIADELVRIHESFSESL